MYIKLIPLLGQQTPEVSIPMVGLGEGESLVGFDVRVYGGRGVGVWMVEGHFTELFVLERRGGLEIS